MHDGRPDSGSISVWGFTWLGKKQLHLMTGLLMIGLGALGPVLLPLMVFVNFDQLPSPFRRFQEHFLGNPHSQAENMEALAHSGLTVGLLIAGVGALQVLWSLRLPSVLSLFGSGWNYSIVMAAGIGALLRIRYFLVGRSLWHDEAALALNFVESTWVQLVTEPLGFSQAAPPGFLLLSNALYELFGPSELMLRLPALVAGVGSLWFSVLAAKGLFTGPLARLVFVTTISLSPALVYYSQELKQYSLDVFATAFALWLVSRSKDTRLHWSVGLVGFALAVMSVTAPLSLLAAAIAIGIRIWKTSKSWAQIINFVWTNLGIGLAWLAGGTIHGVYLLTAGPESNGFFHTFWLDRGGFPTPDGSLASSLMWIGMAVLHATWVVFGPSGPTGAVEGPLGVTLLIAAIAVLGMFARTSVKWFGFSLIALGIVLALVNVYPFSGRLILYQLPALALLVALPLDFSGVQIHKRVITVVSALVLAIPAVYGLGYFARPDDKRDFRWMLEEFVSRADRGDVLTSPGVVARWYFHHRSLAGFSTIELSDFQNSLPPDPVRAVWIIGSVEGGSSQLGDLGPKVRLACDDSVKQSRIQIFVPFETDEMKGLCDFSVKKF